jgi:hypothetical protein
MTGMARRLLCRHPWRVGWLRSSWPSLKGTFVPLAVSLVAGVIAGVVKDDYERRTEGAVSSAVSPDLR